MASRQANISPDRTARLPRLHLVTDDGILGRSDFRSLAEEIARTYGDRVAIHLRGPRASGATLFELAAALMSVADRWGTTLLVNDRVDVALAASAHGVQLGARSMSPDAVRALIGGECWMGASVHSDHEATRAKDDGADFLMAGTIYPSQSHPGRSGAGTDWMRAFIADAPPVIGIGGITPDRIPELRASGAYGAAILGGIWNSPDPTNAVRQYLNRLQ